jgi:hypothetical protein
MLSRAVRAIGIAATMILAAGCGVSSSNSSMQIVPVKGRITYKGESVVKGAVEFEPQLDGRNASGDIQSDGTFVLSTFKPGDGAVVGTHRVFVRVGGDGYGPKPGTARELLPAKFASAESSGLTAEVGDSPAEFQFDLQ